MSHSFYTALLINPFDQTVSQVSIGRGKTELEDIYKLLECNMIETVCPSFGGIGERFVVDEEGLFKEDQKSFYVDGMRLYGKALYVGSKGSLFASPDMEIQALVEKISFVADPFRGWLETFLLEKGIGADHVFEYDLSNTFGMISVGAIVDQVCVLEPSMKEGIKLKMVQIDAANANIMDFLHFIGEYIVKMQVAGQCLQSA